MSNEKTVLHDLINKLDLVVQDISYGQKYSVPGQKNHICFYPTTGTVVVAYKGKPHKSFKTNKTDGVKVLTDNLISMFKKENKSSLEVSMEDILVLSNKYSEKVKVKFKQVNTPYTNSFGIEIQLNEEIVFKEKEASVNRTVLINRAYMALYNALNTALPF